MRSPQYPEHEGEGNSPESETDVNADYAFRVSGRLTRAMLGALDPLEAREASTETLLVGRVVDLSALYGFIARIEALGLELVELRRLPPGDDTGAHGCPSCGRTAKADGPGATRSSL
jgi:hypothetical protein